MYSGLVHAHSGLRWVALLLLVAAVATAFSRWQGRADFTESNRKLYLFTLISVHTQLVLGLVLYFISPKVDFGMMSEKLYRFYTVEHLAGMLIAIALVTVGYSRAKRLSNATAKHKAVAIFMGLGLLLILASIPWPFRIPGAGWF
ncbi:MAG: cytochrome B [Cytophagales bacterium]|nr:MAG: cytochrome B [Cytophagales bacterium]